MLLSHNKIFGMLRFGLPKHYLIIYTLSNLFETKLSSHQFQVLFEIIKVYSSSPIRKEFHIQQFLDNYQFVLSSQQKKKIKDHFIRYL